jgi:RHS repeat-associated protein
MKKLALIAVILAFAANTFVAGAGIAGGGRINKTTSGYEITYFITDHLGSTRVVTTSSGEIKEQNDYYPFGKKHENPDLMTSTNRYLFSGKEKQTTAEINYMDFGSRMYDDFLGRWFTHDPQSYRRPWESPYGYCGGNPVSRIDENGEFWHLIVGAIIGGVINWATNGAKFNAKGLGFFGVGALAGALGAGVGAGISSALAGGSFGAGFWGTSSALTATSSFIYGAAIGGGAGFSSGFVTGFGNGLVNGQYFGKSLAQGGLYGFMAGASGAIVGGVWGGIDAVRDGRNFWHGGRLMTDVSLPIPQGNQVGLYDCNYEVAEQIDACYGYNRNDVYFQSLESGRSGVGLEDFEIGRMYGRAGYRVQLMNIDSKIPLNTVNEVSNTMNNGTPVVLNYKTGITGYTNAGNPIKFGHATAITRVRIFDNGRFIINVMNPSSGYTRFTSLKSIYRLIKIIK